MGLFGGKSSTTVTTTETNYNITPVTSVEVPISIPPADYNELADALQTVGVSLAASSVKSSKAIGESIRESMKYVALAIAAVFLIKAVAEG